MLLDHRSHMARIGKPSGAAAPDRFSSAASFDGWRGGPPHEPPRLTSTAQTWLLATGWKRRGPLSRDETPAARA